MEHVVKCTVFLADITSRILIRHEAHWARVV
jgi:hypothetical protein